MEPLQQFIQEKSTEGSFQDSGGFVVDYSKARDKSRRYNLPRPEQWVSRLLQGFSKLEAQSVDFIMKRKSLRVEVELSPERLRGFSQLFRQFDSSGVEGCIRDAVWGALNKGLTVEFSWWESGNRHGFRADGDSITNLPVRADQDRRLFFEVRPAIEGGLLFRLFGKADFSSEFYEITNAGFLVPFHLNLDGRSYDFESECAGRLLEPASEIRVTKAMEEPMIRAPIFLQQRVRSLTGRIVVETFDYRFLVQTSWNQALRAPQLHWVMDGVRLQSDRLKAWESPLWIDLYVPAQGLETDLTKLKLVKNEALQKRLKEIERFVAYSFLTVPPLRSVAGTTYELVETEARRFAEDVLEEEMAIGLIRFRDQTEEQKNRLDMAREIDRIALLEWQRSKHQFEEVDGVRRSECEERFEAVAGWAKLDVGPPKPDKQAFSEPRPRPHPVKAFFGEVYVRIAGGTPDAEDRAWLKKRGKRF